MPRSACTTPRRPRVHPRASGEAELAQIGSSALPGPSPREREALQDARSLPPAPGPSPRERGSRGFEPPSPEVLRSIPARAGKPRCPRPSRRSAGVHPRVSGEAGVVTGATTRSLGPSPRERGSRQPRHDRAGGHGSIPARAGKPRCASATATPKRVHPRASGEAALKADGSQQVRGPSPRERGSRDRAGAGRRLRGSIPARAGKPQPRGGPVDTPRVHPRASGEAE